MAPPSDGVEDDNEKRQGPQIQNQYQSRPIESTIEQEPTFGDDNEEEKSSGAAVDTIMVGGGGGGGGGGVGWRELKDDDDDAFAKNKRLLISDGRGEMGNTVPSIEIELQETRNTTGSGRRELLGIGRRGGGGGGGGGWKHGFLGLGKTRAGHNSNEGTGARYGNAVTVTTGPASLGPDGVAAARGDGEQQWSPSTYRVYKRRWFGLLQLTLLNIIVSWDWLTFAPVSADAAKYFDTDENTINWLSTAFLFSFVFITPVVIYVLHLGPKPSIVTSSALILVGNWIRYGGSHSSAGGKFGVVMFGQILTGLAQPFVLAAPARYSDLWFTNRGRVAATALTTLANPFGAALGQLIIPFWVSKPGDVSKMVLYVSIISSVACIPSFFIPAAPPTPVAPSSETPKLSLRQSAVILFSHLEFWLVFIAFSVYVGCFNSISSILAQILEPYGYTNDEAGIAGAILIVVGLVASAIFSPIIDRTKSYLTAIRATIPIIGLCYLIFVWMPRTHDSGGLAGPYVVLALLGAASFTLMPVGLEFLVELTHPISPEVTSTLALSGGQLLGGIFIVVSGELKAGKDGDPPLNMHRALVFTAVIAMVSMVPPLCLGLFGRADKVSLKRVKSDERQVGSQGGGPEELGG